MPTKPFYSLKLALCLFTFFQVHLTYAQSNHKEVKSYSFQPESEKVLPGLSTDIGSEFGCDKGILDEDIIGNFAVASQLYQNGCYTDGNYNNKDYPVTKGNILDTDGTMHYTGYQVSKPQHLATKFLGSKHFIHMRFPTQDDYVIYQMMGGVITKAAEVPKESITPDQFVKLPIAVSEIEKPIIYFANKKTERVSIYHALSEEVEGAMVADNGLAKVYKTRYTVSGDLFDTSNGFTAGPASHYNRYGDSRHFLSRFADPEVEVLWQDESNGVVSLTSIIPGGKKSTTLAMPMETGVLAGATAFKDTWYYMIVSTANAKEGWLLSANAKGKLKQKEKLNLGPQGLNIYEYDSAESVSLVYNEGVLGAIISRKMNTSADGLKHQGAIAVTFNAKTLKVMKNHGQTSGHSFDNFLYPAEGGGFYGMDLGDNYPRGINVHKIDEALRSKLVYTFKTAHGQEAASPARRAYPVYTEISNGAQAFYQWSNDNSTYTELGSMVEWDDSYDVYFIGEPDATGKAINNARATSNLTDARDIGMVKIKKDFYGQSNYALSRGIDESSGFYSFGGMWSDQSNSGVKWLVDYKDKALENASRLKAIKGKKGVILFWEQWTENAYESTYMMKVDKDGKPKSEPMEIGPHLRINRSDDPIIVNDRILFVMGNRNDQKLEVIEVALK